MTDVLLVALILAFFGLAALLVRACTTITDQATDFELEVNDDEPEAETVK